MRIAATVSIALLAILAIVVMAAKSHSAKLHPSPQQRELEIHGALLNVVVANTPEERTKGLSGQLGLAPNSGMLFDFRENTTPLMWMKDMHFSLDFIWVDARGKVTDITPAVSPSTWPATFSPALPVRYVIEVATPWASDHEVRVNDVVNGL